MADADRLSIDAAQARLLLSEQCPTLADLEIVPCPVGGTAHVLFRLGRELAIRFPTSAAAATQCRKEQAWLPRIAPMLSVPISTPLFVGEATERFLGPWSVVPWLEGEAAWSASHANRDALGSSVARFINELSTFDAAGGPVPGDHNFGRGVPLTERDAATRTALDQIADAVPVERLAAIWERSLDAEAAVDHAWIHGDLHGGNLIVASGDLAGVIDFGGLAVGDPACDLAFAWFELGPRQRQAFRAATGADDARWARARGWALSIAAIQLPYYRDRHPHIERLARRTLAQVLEDDR
ncbi:MAG: aminoglycoside phosphotransferase family protein [Phycisphaerales bacterium]